MNARPRLFAPQILKEMKNLFTPCEAACKLHWEMTTEAQHQGYINKLTAKSLSSAWVVVLESHQVWVS